MDMTPMVDVTFLLLIFFMVTASFTLQKSVPLPTPQIANPGAPMEKSDIEVTVEIDQHNTFYVSSPIEDSVECPSEREMRQQVRSAVESSSADRMVIRAHVDSLHKKMVAAWDGGVVAGIPKIAVETTTEEW